MKLVKNCYSDDELKEFKELIIGKINAAQDDLNLFKEELRNFDHVSATMTGDGPTAASQKEELSHFAGRLQKVIAGLNAALVRIENKTYGICVITKKLIPKERLRAVPHTTQCIEVKSKSA